MVSSRWLCFRFGGGFAVEFEFDRRWYGSAVRIECGGDCLVMVLGSGCRCVW